MKVGEAGTIRMFKRHVRYLDRYIDRIVEREGQTQANRTSSSGDPGWHGRVRLSGLLPCYRTLAILTIFVLFHCRLDFNGFYTERLERMSAERSKVPVQPGAVARTPLPAQ